MLHQASLIALVLAGSSGDAPPTKTKAAAGVAKSTLVSVDITDKNYLASVVQPDKKRVVFVDFWASYCAPCLDELPHLEAMKARLGKDADVAFVNVDPPGSDIAKVLDKRNVKLAKTFRVANEDPQPFIDAVDPKWMGEVPFGALYDRNGKLVRTFSGEQKIEDIEKAVREVLASK